MGYNRVIVTGSLAYDHIMSMPVRFKDYIMPDKIHMLNVSFMMDQFRKEFGGTAGNIVFTLSMLEVPSLLVAAAGNDFDPYMAHLSPLDNVDLSGVALYQDVATAQGFVMTDQDDNQIWGFYQGAMKNARLISLRPVLREGDLLMISPNDPEAMINHAKEAVSARVDYVFDPAFNIPRVPVDELAFAIQYSKVVVGNDYEIELMRRSVKMPETEFFGPNRMVVTTLGAQGVKLRLDKQEFSVPAAKIGRLADPTGAGDAFRAGFMAGLAADKDPETCARMGAVAAAYVVENYGTQTCRYSRPEFAQRFRDSYGVVLDGE